MRFGITMVGADGKALEVSPGESPDLIGAVVQTSSAKYIAVSLAPQMEARDRNFGVYSTFELAVEALRGATMGVDARSAERA